MASRWETGGVLFFLLCCLRKMACSGFQICCRGFRAVCTSKVELIVFSLNNLVIPFCFCLFSYFIPCLFCGYLISFVVCRVVAQTFVGCSGWCEGGRLECDCPRCKWRWRDQFTHCAVVELVKVGDRSGGFRCLRYAARRAAVWCLPNGTGEISWWSLCSQARLAGKDDNPAA